MRVFIVGFPRTGTTHIYRYLTSRLSWNLRLYEPFNTLHLLQHLKSGETCHDVEGCIPNDLDKLDRGTLNLLVKNSFWFVRWLSDDLCSFPIPYLGLYFWQILENLLKRDNVIIKDIYVWPALPYIVEKFRDVKVIIPVRDFASVYYAHVDWFRKWQRTLLRRARAGIVQLLTGMMFRRKVPVSKISRAKALSSLIKLSYSYGKCPEMLVSICIFYRLINDKGQIPKIRTVKDVARILALCYRTYVRIVRVASRFENVLVLGYRGLLRREHLEKCVRFVLA